MHHQRRAQAINLAKLDDRLKTKKRLYIKGGANLNGIVKKNNVGGC